MNNYTTKLQARGGQNYEQDLGIDSDEESLEVPSCIDSLASSCDQLEQLASDVSRYYIRTILCYSYSLDSEGQSSGELAGSAGESEFRDVSANGSKKVNKFGRPIQPNKLNPSQAQPIELGKLNADVKFLGHMKSLIDLLPLLRELNSFVDRCFATIEFTLKRSNYYLTKALAKRQSTRGNLMEEDEFQFTVDIKFHPIFVALMDLIFALVSLNETIRKHSNICEGLTTLKTVCQLVIDTESLDKLNLEDISKLPKERLSKLVNLIGEIQSTFCNDKRTIFQQCLEHVQHLNLILSMNKVSIKGEQHKNLGEHWEEFIIYFGENLIEIDRSLETIAIAATNSASSSSSHLGQLKSHSIYLCNLNLIPTQYMTSTPRRVFGFICLFTLYSWIFKRADKRVNGVVMQVLRKFKTINLLHLFGSNCHLLLSDFMAEHLPKSMLDPKLLRQLQSHSDSLLRLNMIEEFDRLTMKTLPWLVKFKAEWLRVDARAPQVLGQFFNALHNQNLLIWQGIGLVEETNHLIKSLLTVHLHHNKPMTKNNLILLFRLVSLLKSIQASLIQSRVLVEERLIRAERITQIRWKRLMVNLKKRLVSLKYSDRKLSTNSALKLCSICCWSQEDNQLASNQSRASLAFSLSMLLSSLNHTELGELNQLLHFSRLDIYERLEDSANCGYLYWNMHTFGAYYNHAFEEDPSNLDELHYFHLALNDIANLFTIGRAPTWSVTDCRWLEVKSCHLLSKLGEDLMDQFKVHFLDKVCQEFEIELRLQVHSELHLDGSHNPFRRHLYNFKQIFAQSKARTTFRILNQIVSLRYYVEHHLNKICYNLTAIAPQDWFTYDRMINLARRKYNLQFVNTQLPTQTLDYGLDLMDITRNLALFASRYSYDLTNQLFIEKCSNRLSTSSVASMFSGGGGMLTSSNNTSAISSSTFGSQQSLNVVQIKHIARSIQTHGYGLLNSSVNCTYQVMKRLINLISKQLLDDKLRAILSKEHQRYCSQLAKTAGSSANMISFDRANKMAKQFKLNLLERQQIDSGANQMAVNLHQSIGTDLDSLRQSITQLGNLLAFIRLLKSGALNCASKSVDYLPDLDSLSILRLKKCVENEFQGYPSEHLVRAAENFDQCLTDFDENFSAKTNYFNIIISLFTKILFTEDDGRSSNESKATKTLATSKQDNQQLAFGQEESGESSGGDMATTRSFTGAHHPSAASVGDDEPQKGERSSKRNDHLRLFFLLVPALTINYIDYLINCKERVTSRSSATRFGALLSDDGFPMGVAFLLTILKQAKDFGQLEWFGRVKVKLEEDMAEVDRRANGEVGGDESMRQMSSLTLRRLRKLRNEYDGLDFTLSSAMLFFRNSTCQL